MHGCTYARKDLRRRLSKQPSRICPGRELRGTPRIGRSKSSSARELCRGRRRPKVCGSSAATWPTTGARVDSHRRYTTEAGRSGRRRHRSRRKLFKFRLDAVSLSSCAGGERMQKILPIANCPSRPPSRRVAPIRRVSPAETEFRVALLSGDRVRLQGLRRKRFCRRCAARCDERAQPSTWLRLK